MKDKINILCHGRKLYVFPYNTIDELKIKNNNVTTNKEKNITFNNINDIFSFLINENNLYTKNGKTPEAA